MAGRRRRRRRLRIFKPKAKTRRRLSRIAVSCGIAAILFFLLWLPKKNEWRRPYRPLPAPVREIPQPVPRGLPSRPPAPLSAPLPPISVKPRPGLLKPKIVLVIDDIGNNLNYQKQLQSLGNRVTYAILPGLRYSKRFAQMGRTTGAEVILHLPLETVDGIYPGPGLITDGMEEPAVKKMLAQNIASVPDPAGVNNHMGSRGTADPRLMNIILRDLKDRGLFFLDSRTTTESVAFKVGKTIGLPVLRRDVFLDNEDNADYIYPKIAELKALARKRGSAVGIGHYRYNTLVILAEEIPRLERDGFEIHSLSELIEAAKSGNS